MRQRDVNVETVWGCGLGSPGLRQDPVANTTVDLVVPNKAENFLTRWATVSFWRTVLHTVIYLIQLRKLSLSKFVIRCCNWVVHLSQGSFWGRGVEVAGGGSGCRTLQKPRHQAASWRGPRWERASQRCAAWTASKWLPIDTHAETYMTYI
jgi:hypothetical protein